MPNSTVNTFTDYDVEERGIARRRKMAEALQAQAGTPLAVDQQAGGFAIPVSPYAGMAKLLQGYSAGAANQRLDEQEKALGQRYRTEGNDALIRGLQAMQGAPATAGSAMPPDELGGGPAQPALAAVAPNMNDASAAFGSHPATQPYAAALLAHALKSQDPYTLAEGAQRIGPNGQVLANNPKGYTMNAGDTRFGPDGKPIVTAPQKPMIEHNFSVGENQVQPHISLDGGVTWTPVPGSTPSAKFAKQVGTVVHNPPAVTAVTVQDPENPNATIVVDGRSGKVIGKGPKLTDVGKLENKRQFNMQGIGATIKTAEDLLTGATGKDLPTGSTMGNVADTVAGVFGMSPAGAKEAETLKAVGGALVSKMPRMEGPQSDKDVILYKEMAGRVGDPTVPRDRRIAALEQVKELWAKYENLNPGAFSDRRANAGAPPPGAVQRLP